MSIDGAPVCSRSRHLHRRRPRDADPRTEDDVEMLRGAPTTAPDSSFRAVSNPTDARNHSGIVATGLRKRRVGWPPGLPDVPSSVCHARVSTVDPSATPLRPHCRHVDESPLASCAGACSVQGRSPCI